MKISVYSTTTCPYCVKLKQWLTEQKLSYEDILIDRDPVEARRMVQLSGQMGVPFTTVETPDGKTYGVLGFDTAALSQIITKL